MGSICSTTLDANKIIIGTLVFSHIQTRKNEFFKQNNRKLQSSSSERIVSFRRKGRGLLHYHYRLRSEKSQMMTESVVLLVLVNKVHIMIAFVVVDTAANLAHAPSLT